MAGRWRDGIQADTRANQPAFGDVAIGTLYFVTDEDLLERSTGSAWVEVGINTDFHDAHDHTGVPGVGGGSGTGLLAVVSYGPGTTGTYTTTTTQADVDGTNVRVTFTAPASGNVLVRATMQAFPNSTTGSLRLGLRESTTDIVNAQQVAADLATSDIILVSWAAYLTGVTAGSHTYKLAASHVTNSWTLRWGDGAGDPTPVVLEVWEAP